MIEIVECEQGSDEWFAARLGIPTASEFSTILAKGRDGGESKTRRTYMLKLAGEILTGKPAESYRNDHMDRGQAMEDEARQLYAFMQDQEPTQVGFVRNGDMGCSPDSLIGEDGGLEIKTALPHIQIDRLLKGELPPEHKAQVQGCMWVTCRNWWDFMSFWPGLPPLIVRVPRDEGYITSLHSSVSAFNTELKGVVETVRRYGLREAA